MSIEKKRAIVWFRNDLRLRDNLILQNVLKEADEIIPIYCFDNQYFQEIETIRQPKMGTFRTQFILESLADLNENLKIKGSWLHVCKGNTANEIKRIAEQYNATHLYYSKEITFEEIQIEKEVTTLDLEIHTVFQQTLFSPEDAPFEIEKTPFVFTEFRKKLEKYAELRNEIEAPAQIPSPKKIKETSSFNLNDLGLTEVMFSKKSVLNFKGGETEAWQRLQHYFFETDSLREYKETRNGMLGADYSSKFSAWLAQGCISALSIYHQVKKYESERVSNQSTYWMVFELLWRDFFKFTALKEGKRFFKMKQHQLDDVNQKFENWRLGNTGEPFIDANMKELLQTGYMSNRGRQNVASYLLHDLKLPWYLGAQWFESQLIDYDVTSNYGNWTYVAGVGHDPRKDRYFNIQKQAERYDTEGAYQRFWNEG